MAGWIKLYRQIQESEIWETIQPFDIRSAWIDLLLLASHEDRNMIIGDQVVKVKRGQYVTSIRFLSQRWCWSKDRVSKCLTLLERLGMIDKHSDSKRTVVTIVNYGKFQDCQDTDKDSDKDSERTLSGHKTDADKDKIQEYIKNDKKGKKGKNNTPYNPPQYYPNDETLDKAFEDYIAMRKQIKKPMTNRAIDLAIKKLDELSGGDNDIAIKIIEQSVMNSWQGLFPLKTETRSQGIDWSRV